MDNLLNSGQWVMQVGLFSVRVQTSIPRVMSGLECLYSEYPKNPSDSFSDFFIRIFQPQGLRKYWRKQVLFAFDQYMPFKPLPYTQSLHFFEWGLNWCVSGYAHQFLILHAAVVEKNNRALILPGIPGAGKSTLCASLINQGWRLLSDELALVDLKTGDIFPVPRPVSLKNESIDIIKNNFPDNYFSDTVHDTLKGSVALMKAPAASVHAMTQSVKPAFIVFPRYQSGASLNLLQLDKPAAFMKLAELSFNYSVLGKTGFSVLARLVQQTTLFDFEYGGQFNDAFKRFDDLIYNS